MLVSSNVGIRTLTIHGRRSVQSYSLRSIHDDMQGVPWGRISVS